jgi:hypothetical protein
MERQILGEGLAAVDMRLLVETWLVGQVALEL